MKILNFSLDKSILDPDSDSAKRIAGFGSVVEKYTVITKSLADQKIKLSENVEVYGIGLDKGKILAFLKGFLKGLKLVYSEKYDIITSQDPYYVGILSFILSKISGAKFEVQIHGLERYYGIRKKVFNFVVKKAGLIRVVSQRMKKEIIALAKIGEKKIYILPVFVDTEKFKNIIRNYENKGKFIFLTVGRLVPVKNTMMQIEAMEEIVKKHPNTEIAIVGDGVLRNKLETAVKEKELENNIKFYGFQKDTKSFYEKADAFILSSNSEGWGMVVIEAAASGLPVIMTDVGCAEEVLKSNESAIIIPVGGKKELAENMIRIIEDQGLRKNIGEGGKRAVTPLPKREEYLDIIKRNWESVKK